MTADEFVEIVRKGSDKLRVDEVVLVSGNKEFHGKGKLRIGEDRIEIDINLDSGEKPPPRWMR